jgi:hypothetical protein
MIVPGEKSCPGFGFITQVAALLAIGRNNHIGIASRGDDAEITCKFQVVTVCGSPGRGRYIRRICEAIHKVPFRLVSGQQAAPPQALAPRTVPGPARPARPAWPAADRFRPGAGRGGPFPAWRGPWRTAWAVADCFRPGAACGGPFPAWRGPWRTVSGRRGSGAPFPAARPARRQARSRWRLGLLGSMAGRSAAGWQRRLDRVAERVSRARRPADSVAYRGTACPEFRSGNVPAAAVLESARPNSSGRAMPPRG